MEPPREKVSSVAVKRRKKFLGCSLLEHFELGQKVGVGTFGEVLKAKHSSNGKVVALKKIFTKSEQEGFPITSLREIKLLKNVSHPNVASLIDMAVSYKTVGNDFKEVDDIYMVFPFMDHDLTGILENQNISLSLPQIKCYMKQLLEGIAYLHQRQIMHRDLKGANLLVNNRGELKITDFGLARPIEENRIKYTPGVVTRWYRPPELLFGSDVYNESIDIWGVGCIIAEMYLRKPLFGASSDLDQLKTVFKYCGTPTEENYPGVSELPDFSKVQFKPEKRILKEYLESKKLDKAAVDLIDKMLVLDPKQRITAQQALEHEYFKCEPLPCLPSEIGQFESSHVYTVQQQKEKEQQEQHQIQSESKRSRTEQDRRHEERSYRYKEQEERSHRYNDHDSRHPDASNYHRHEQLKYGDQLPPPPPPPPPSQPPSTLRDRHASSRDDIARENDRHHEHRRHHDDYRYTDRGHSDTHNRPHYDDYPRSHEDRHHHSYREDYHNHREDYQSHREDHHLYYNRHDERDRRVNYDESRNYRSSHHASYEEINSSGERIVLLNSSISEAGSQSRSRSPERKRLSESSGGSGAERSRRTISYEDL